MKGQSLTVLLSFVLALGSASVSAQSTKITAPAWSASKSTRMDANAKAPKVRDGDSEQEHAATERGRELVTRGDRQMDELKGQTVIVMPMKGTKGQVIDFKRDPNMKIPGAIDGDSAQEHAATERGRELVTRGDRQMDELKDQTVIVMPVGGTCGRVIDFREDPNMKIPGAIDGDNMREHLATERGRELVTRGDRQMDELKDQAVLVMPLNGTCGRVVTFPK